MKASYFSCSFENASVAATLTFPELLRAIVICRVSKSVSIERLVRFTILPTAILTGFCLKESRQPEASISFTRDEAASFQSAIFILLTERRERAPPASIRLAESDEQPETASKIAAEMQIAVFIFFIFKNC